jgi:signal transduction histidine kinase
MVEVPAAEDALQSLRTSHYRLSTILESLAEGVAQYDRSGRLQAANARARQLLPEADLDELERFSLDEDGRIWPEGTHPLGQVLRSGQPRTGLVLGIPQARGPMLWVSVNAMPLRHQGREPWGLVLSLTDITERRQTQRRNELVADLLQMAHRSEDLGTLAAAMADRLALWSRCALVAIRFRTGAGLQLHHSQGQAGGDPRAGLDPALLASAEAGAEARILEQLAGTGWESRALLPLHLEGGPGSCLLFLDRRRHAFAPLAAAALKEVASITANILAKALAEQALAERAEALARSRAQLAQALALARLGTWSLDLATGHMDWSAETYLQWDADPAQAPPDFADLAGRVHPEDRPAFLAFRERLRTSRFTEELELRVLAPGGAARHLFLQAIPLTGRSEPPGRFQGACMDITSRKANELALRDLVKLSAKSQMAAYIAHEINNPLAGIRNAFQLLDRGFPADHPHREYIPLINREIDRIASIIRTMYHLYRPEPASPRPVVLAEVFHDLESLLGPKCRNHRISLAFDPDRLGPLAGLNEGLLRQVLFNLAQNALEASPAGGVVTVTARSAGGWLEVAVGDSGCGIAPADAEKIFQSGFTTKVDTEMSGLGLGLATCRSLVESMGGSLAFLAREPGPGTVFTVRLPFANPE